VATKKLFLVGEQMKRLGSWLCLALVVVGLLSVPLMAQKTSGTIRGVVTDPSGAAVANVPVTIKNNSTGLERSVTTNTQGEYVAPELASGLYTLTVKAANFGASDIRKECPRTAVRHEDHLLVVPHLNREAWPACACRSSCAELQTVQGSGLASPQTGFWVNCPADYRQCNPSWRYRHQRVAADSRLREDHGSCSRAKFQSLLTQPEDMARCIAALCHPATYWLTGNTLHVDGGENIVG